MLTSFLFLFLIRATSPNSRRSFRNILSSPFEHRRVLNIDYHYFLDDHGDDFLIIFAARDKRWIVRRLRFPPLRLATTRRRTSVTGLSRKWVSVHSSFPLHRLYNFLQPRVFQTLLPSPSFENLYFHAVLTRHVAIDFKSSPSGNCSRRENMSRTLWKEKKERRIVIKQALKKLSSS